MKPETKLMAVLLVGILLAPVAMAYVFIESVSHELIGDDEIKIIVVITNPGPDDRDFTFHVKRDSDGKKMESERVGLVDAGETVTGTLSSKWSSWDVYGLEGGYIIELEDYDLGVVDIVGPIDLAPPGKPVACACSCEGVLIESPVHEDDYEKCPELCSKQCAGLTDCGRADENCGSCCSSYCQNAGLPLEGVAACEASCEDACDFNRAIYGLINVIRYIALAIAAVVFAVCGLRFIISEDPESRRQAKRCFLYIIFALTLIGIAQALVSLFYERPDMPTAPPITSKDAYVQEIGDAVVACWVSSTGGPDRVCTKIDSSDWEIYTVTEDDVKNYLDGIGESDIKDDMDWKIGEGINKHLPEMVCIKYDTSGGNEVFVLKQNQDVMCIGFSDETKQIGDAVVACWESSTGGPDRICSKPDVSGWAPGVTVAEVNVKNYLVSIGEGDIKDDMDWKIGTSIDQTLGERVCIKYDTSWGNEVFVLKESNPDCS